MKGGKEIWVELMIKKKSEVRSSVDMPGKGEERRGKEMCKEDRGYVEDSDERGWDGEPRGRREGGEVK